MDAIHKEEYKGYTIEIHHDEFAADPREDFDPFGHIFCFHGRYNLGDEHDYDKDMFTSWDGFREQIEEDYAVAVILPVYLYDHSGLHLKVGSFQGMLPQGHAEFDSGQVGWTFCTKEEIRENFMPEVKRVTKKVLERAERLLRAEVNTYDQFLKGDVYGYVVHFFDQEDIDSCWGFYGMDYCLEEAKGAVDWQVQKDKEFVAEMQAEEIGEEVRV